MSSVTRAIVFSSLGGGMAGNAFVNTADMDEPKKTLGRIGVLGATGLFGTLALTEALPTVNHLAASGARGGAAMVAGGVIAAGLASAALGASLAA